MWRMHKCLALVIAVAMFLPIMGYAQLADLPRDETVIVSMLTGRVGTPGNFNEWVGWKWRDRGM